MKRMIFFLFLPMAFITNAQKWTKNFDFVDPCICGLSLVSKDHMYGFVDRGGNIIIPLQYDEALTFSEGYSALRKGSKWMYVDSTGKSITDAVYEDAQSFHNGFAAVMKDQLYGYINTSGKLVIGYQYYNARDFGEDLAPVANKKGEWGYINTSGEIMITPQYDFADHFENGEARVMKGDKLFYIDRKNKVLHE
jgi:hypothetical protein